jgi:tetratricopeptide (TPR) repeat protein
MNKQSLDNVPQAGRVSGDRQDGPGDSGRTNSETFTSAFRTGTQLLHAGDIDGAIPMLELAARENAAHLDANLNLSGAYILSGQFKKAVRVLEALAESNPDHVMIWTNLGAAYLGNPVLARDADQLRAITAFERALAIDPAAPHLAYNLGLVYQDRRDVERARYWFEIAIQHDPEDRDARKLLLQLDELD